MREKPPLPDATIIACLRDHYHLTITELEFLPLGNDSSASVYRASADDGRAFLLKLKRDPVFEPGLQVPRYLKDQGMKQVVVPLPTITGTLWRTVDDFALILYPFIDGDEGMAAGLSDRQWLEYGAVVRQLHASQLPADLLAQVPRETFVPQAKWSGVIRELQATVPTRNYDHPAEQELAQFWQDHHAEIQRILDRTAALGRELQKRSLDFVLYHGDIHTANLLLTPEGDLFVVDWDQPVIAPKERDLMFIVGGTVQRSPINEREQALFFQSYGPTEIDWPVLAYYRYEWLVQDIGDYGERVFLLPDAGDITKHESVAGLKAMFDPGAVVDVAYELNHLLPE
jgi:spectinomycin phosphotransferase